MPTYEFWTPREAVERASGSAREFETIVGLIGMDADRLRPRLTRTAAGYMRKPDDPWRAHGDRDKMREIAAVEYVRADADPGTVEVHFADGGSTYLNRFDLLCVERPV